MHACTEKGIQRFGGFCNPFMDPLIVDIRVWGVQYAQIIIIIICLLQTLGP
jgi:hypothetical protein